MEATLSALGGILLRAVPTLILVVLLHFYLKSVFFKPIARVLQERYEATEGARKLAEQSMERAAAKTAEYEAALRAARAEAYLAQEQLHKELQDKHAAEMLAARQRAEETVKRAKADLAKDVEAARQNLSRDAEVLADQITETILRRSVA